MPDYADDGKTFTRHSFQECMQLTRIPSANSKDAQRYMSHQQPWRPGQDLGWSMNTQRSPERQKKFGPGTYGAHVYAQASYAAAKAIEEDKSIQSASQLAISVSLIVDRVA